jgi:hypothetical protein
VADNVDITAGAGTTVATDDVSGVHYQRVKLVDGTLDSSDAIPGSATDGLLVNLGANNDVSVSGTVTADAGTGPWPVTDNNGSLTVDGSVTASLAAGTNNIGDVDVLTVPAPLSTTGGGTEATALRVTIATDSTGVLSVDDNGGAITVDGTVTANAGTGPFPVSDNAGSLTVDAPVGTPLFARLSDGTAALTTSGGRLSVDASGAAVPVTDNASSLTVDQATAASLNAQVVGAVAQDSGVGSNPVTIGGRASTAQPTAMSADGDVVHLWANRRGALVTASAPHAALTGTPWTLAGSTAQYTTTQTSAALVTASASQQIVVTSVQIQAGGTTAGTMQLYFGTGAYSRGTTPAVFDGEFAPSSTSKPGVVMQGPFIGAADADLRVTTSAAINPLTVTVWYYFVS